MSRIESWEHFNVFDVSKLVSGHILAAVVWFALEHYDLIEKLDLPEDKLFNFLSVRLPCLGDTLLSGLQGLYRHTRFSCVGKLVCCRITLHADLAGPLADCTRLLPFRTCTQFVYPVCCTSMCLAWHTQLKASAHTETHRHQAATSAVMRARRKWRAGTAQTPTTTRCTPPTSRSLQCACSRSMTWQST
jgi:hypothetical protein